MTYERLTKYRMFKRIIALFNNDKNMTRVNNMDLYDDIVAECELIEKYICNINDPEIKVIAEMHILFGYSFSKIGEAMHYDRRTVSRKLLGYIAHNAHIFDI
jgi:hypothetical protein